MTASPWVETAPQCNCHPPPSDSLPSHRGAKVTLNSVMSGGELASGVGICPPASALPPTADVNNNGLEGVSLQIKNPAGVRFLVPLPPLSRREAHRLRRAGKLQTADELVKGNPPPCYFSDP